jgi:hypothetical protein
VEKDRSSKGQMPSLQHGRPLLSGKRLDVGYLEALAYTVREEEMA